MRIIDKDKIIFAIDNSTNIQNVFKILKCSQKVLKRSCDYYNINYPNYKDAICDKNFFSIPTELSMYWAGFIAADGNLRKQKSYSIKLELASKDRGHIIEFTKQLKSDAHIHDIKRGPLKLNKTYKDYYEVSYVIINSQKIFEDLGKYNIVPRKTYIYEMPDWLVKHELVRHFIRGYVDGDGSFSFNKRNGEIVSVRMSMTSATKVSKQIFDILREKCNTRYGGSYQNGTDNRFWFNSLNDIKNITEYIYNDATIFLKRKKDIADFNLKLLKKSSLYNFDPKKIQKLYDEFGSFNAVAKIYGCDRATIRGFMHNMNLKYKVNPEMVRIK